MATQEILQKRARTLRKQNTRAEYYLWRYLRARRFEKYKFRRQHIIGTYIVDFVCLWKKIIEEVHNASEKDNPIPGVCNYFSGEPDPQVSWEKKYFDLPGVTRFHFVKLD